MNKRRELLYKDEFVSKAAELRAADVFHIVGNDSIFVPRENTSYINRNSCREWCNLDGEFTLMTPGEVARCELERYFPEVKMRARRSDFALLDIYGPMHYDGQLRQGVFTMFDLKGAYWQIYRYLTLDVRWPRGVGSLWLWDVANRLEGWKTARNTLVGVTRAHSITVYKGSKLQWQKFTNRWFNPHLWHTIMVVLHEIAAVALRLGCVYIATDSYIFDNDRAAGRFLNWTKEAGFDVHEYGRGEGTIRGWGSYSIDGVRGTARDTRTEHRLDNVDRHMEMETVKWLMKIRATSF